MKTIRLFLTSDIIGYGGADQVYNYCLDYYKNLNDIIYELQFKNTFSAKNAQEVILKAYTNLCAYKNLNVLIYVIRDGMFVNADIFKLLKQYFPKSKIIMYSGGNSIFKRVYKFNKSVSYINDYVDLLIANSKFSYYRYIKLNITCPIIILRGGVNYNYKKLTKSDLNLPLDCKIICLPARFIKWKGLYSTIKELNLDAHLRLLLIGDSSNLHPNDKCDDENFYNLIKDKKYITVLNHIDNEKLLAIMSLSDVVINCPTPVLKKIDGHEYLHTETFGRTLCEAISVGTPIVALNTGAIKEFFDENTTYIGELISDLSELNTAINKALTVGRTKTKLDYSWEKYFSSLDNYIKENFYGL